MTATAVPYGCAVRTVVHLDELDAMGLLHEGCYAVLVERTISAWWAERGVSFADGEATSPDAFTVVRNFAITHHRPIRGAGDIVVHFWVEWLGPTSIDYQFRVTSSDDHIVYAVGHRLAVRLDPATLQPAPWTVAGREQIAPLLKPQAHATPTW